MKRQNLHCHTSFDDGKNSPEEMVLAALRAGFGSIGVSLHCPIDGEEAWTCPVGEEQRFIDEMRRLQTAYAGRIAVWQERKLMRSNRLRNWLRRRRNVRLLSISWMNSSKIIR